MAGKDPLFDAIMKLKKTAPDAVKNNKALMSEAANLEKSLKAKDGSYTKKIASFLKALGSSKKEVKKDATATKFVDGIEKIARADEKMRTKGVREKTSKPS